VRRENAATTSHMISVCLLGFCRAISVTLALSPALRMGWAPYLRMRSASLLRGVSSAVSDKISAYTRSSSPRP